MAPFSGRPNSALVEQSTLATTIFHLWGSCTQSVYGSAFKRRGGIKGVGHRHADLGVHGRPITYDLLLPMQSRQAVENETTVELLQ